MTGEFSETWLGLREPADAEARAADLVALLPGDIHVIRDLGCGTGSMARWLAPRLPKPQHWILTDLDPKLLHYATAHVRVPDVSVEGALADVTALTVEDLDGTGLVTCSALLDLLTADEIDALVATLAAARVPALFTLSVAGEVRLDPADPLDASVAEAFDEHQRRVTGGRRLLGPDAPAYAGKAFELAGATVVTRPSPWRLGTELPELTAEWLRGWVGAAREQRNSLDLDGYLAARLASLPSASVGHVDLLATFD
ncbi:class I SAM-dependent methyltransferase [Paractinoplanes lichenicola]|uniref:Class I SAM-dependent methyltransferase n=1 Tax=Paractinoplanes lichenicola TaxID=2802976 RepID=A0ABS1VXC3_9ACTN|nr:class I SAM-dependent methyltransferase [Actinoplanes lichenicola]MBL7259133.1 class I SAM-dependent methyltransferase [Actinoplanes lichenicola]